MNVEMDNLPWVTNVMDQIYADNNVDQDKIETLENLHNIQWAETVKNDSARWQTMLKEDLKSRDQSLTENQLQTKMKEGFDQLIDLSYDLDKRPGMKMSPVLENE